MTALQLTDEQRAVIEASRRGVRRLKVEALAGTGKTSTLVELAKDLKSRRSNQKTLYVAFNRFVVDEVSIKIGRFADAMTVNSLALKMVGREYSNKLSESPQRMTARQAADLLGIKNDVIYRQHFEHPNGTHGSREFRLTRSRMAGLVNGAILRFCDSLDRELDQSYFDDSINLGPLVGMAPVPSEVKDLLLAYAVEYWSDISDPVSRRFRFRHEHYMKLWHLSDPVIPYETILFDEAQDADPLMRDVVERHRGQVVWCGDRYQAIYGWRGAVNAMQEVIADETLYLTKSFRFSDAVAQVANRFLDPLGGRLVEGASSHHSQVVSETTPDVEIFRKNLTLIERFMGLTHAGIEVRTDVDLGEYERVVVGLVDLRAGRRPKHQDLAEFSSFQELADWLRDREIEDDEFRIMLRQVMRHDLESFLSALQIARASSGHSKGRLLTTAHKVKGLGFDRVIVADDFPAFSYRDERIDEEDLVRASQESDLPRTKPWKGGKYVAIPRAEAPDLYRESGLESPDSGTLWWLCPSHEEWHLAYVAVTRAQRELVHPFVHVESSLSRVELSSAEGQSRVREEKKTVVGGNVSQWSAVTVGSLYVSQSADITVAGTSYCQEALRVVSGRVAKSDDGWHVSASISREPDNRFDPHAVVVEVDGLKVGYIPKEFAQFVGESLVDSSFRVPALIVGGFELKGKTASFGLRLYLGWG